MSGSDQQAVVATHSELWGHYGRLLGQVDQPKTGKMLKVLVEGHIRDKLIQLSKAYARLGIKRGGAQDEFGAWLKGAAADCDQIANQLTSPKEALLTPLNLVIKILVVLASLMFFLYFGTSDIANVLAEFREDIETFSKALITIINISAIGSMIIFFSLIKWILRLQAKKEALFGSPINASAQGETPSHDTNIHALEYQLFSMLGTGYKPAIPLPMVIITAWINSVYLFAYGAILLETKPAMETIIMLFGGATLGNTLWYLALIRAKLKPIPPDLSLALDESQP